MCFFNLLFAFPSTVGFFLHKKGCEKYRFCWSFPFLLFSLDYRSRFPVYKRNVRLYCFFCCTGYCCCSFVPVVRWWIEIDKLYIDNVYVCICISVDSRKNLLSVHFETSEKWWEWFHVVIWRNKKVMAEQKRSVKSNNVSCNFYVELILFIDWLLFCCCLLKSFSARYIH